MFPIDGPVPLADPPAQDADDVIWLDEVPADAEHGDNGVSGAVGPLSDDLIPPEYLPVAEEEEEEDEEGEYELEEAPEPEVERAPPDFSLEPVMEPTAEEVQEPPRRRRPRARHALARLSRTRTRKTTTIGGNIPFWRKAVVCGSGRDGARCRLSSRPWFFWSS